MQFQQIVGHHNTKMQLTQMVNTNRIPHAIMLSGKEGSGVLPMAIALAQYIMCANKQGKESCNECAACLKNEKMQHPDVHYNFPVVKLDPNKIPTSDDFIKKFREAVNKDSYLNINDWLLHMKAENKAPNITAKECREIIKKLQLRAYEGGFKILICWLPEFLGIEGNILLKLIEEPPNNTIIIFATEQYQNILATIQSRVQLVQLNALTDVEIKDYLIAQGQAANTSMQAARMAMGNFREAKLLLGDAENDFYPVLKDWFNCLFTNNGPALLQWVTQVADAGREQNKLFLQYVINTMGYLLRIKNTNTQDILLHAAEMDLIQKLINKQISEPVAENITNICADAILHIERNINTKIVLHGISLQAKDAFNGKSLYL
jgi:DNA polymerase III subunit delta'